MFVDRKLVTNPKEVDLVNIILNRFAALKSIALLAQELNKQVIAPSIYQL